jgi:hypothetical protein
VAKKTLTTRLAGGALGASLFTFLGPGLHLSSNPGAGRGQLAGEGAVLGIIIGLVAIGLAVIALRRFGSEEDKTGVVWAKVAAVISILGILAWVGALLMRGTG